MKIKCLILILFISTFNAQALVVLQYHHVSEATPPTTSISPELFEQQLKYLADNQYKVLSLEQFVQKLKSGNKLPDKSVVITFDDGYRSIYDTAFPLLKKYHYPFTVFVNTQPIEQQLTQFMDWHELNQMTKFGATIANHSRQHDYLVRRLKDETFDRWQARITKDILFAQTLIEKHTKSKVKVKALAYPYGEYNRALESIIASLGFVAFGQQSGAVLANFTTTAIPRFPMTDDFGQMSDFITKVQSLPLPLKNVLLYDQNNLPLDDHLLTIEQTKPKLLIQLEVEFSQLNLACYLNGDLLKKSKQNNGWLFETEVELPPARSRYNCTAKDTISDRFYWFSQPFIRPE